ncbi:MAG: Crp/Fnr family transcriptional regulator [Eubacteriales bacterium]|jgi:CRP-like cAMP-binding protein
MQEAGCNRKNCEFRARNTYCISEVRLFRGLSPELQAMLASHSIHRTYPADAHIVSENDTIHSVIIIRNGKVKISRTDAMGEEHILDVLHDGQSVWHGIFLKKHRYNYDVIAMEEVRTCEIPRSVIMEMIEKNPQISLSMIEMLARDMTDAEDRLLVLSIREPRQRVAAFLLRKERSCLGDVINLKLEDIASSVNLRPETVSRNITYLEKEGMIRRIGKGCLKVTDHKKLREFSESTG